MNHFQLDPGKKMSLTVLVMYVLTILNFLCAPIYFAQFFSMQIAIWRDYPHDSVSFWDL